MSQPPSPRSTLSVEKRGRNASFSVRSATDLDDDKSRRVLAAWRSACDKTKDKTKELFKRTLSWKGRDSFDEDMVDRKSPVMARKGWTVHVWTTWVRRSSMTDGMDDPMPITISTIQKEKFTHFFIHLLDQDRDDLISAQDFGHLSERLRHYADWSISSTEFSLLQQVQQEFVKTFFPNKRVYLSIDDWLRTWSCLLNNIQGFHQLPFWIRQLPKVLFLVVNKSGNGVITKEEFKIFYLSVITPQLSDDEINNLFRNVTSNEDFALKCSIYELCFANWLLSKNPNGPGQWLFGKCGNSPEYFPIDYSALNTPVEEQETYAKSNRSNRHSVII